MYRDYHAARRICCAQDMPGQDTGVSGTELDHEILFIVVGHQSKIHDDLFLSFSFDVSL